jgi:hypothetical protein
MLITPTDIDRFHRILRDLRARRLPAKIAPSALFAFFVENPHLLMVKQFDEHMQQPVPDQEAESLMNLASVDSSVSFLDFKLPRLEFRTHAGRWAGLIKLPFPVFHEMLDGDVDFDSEEFLFSFNLRRVLRKKSWLASADFGGEEYLEFLGNLRQVLRDQVIALSMEDFIAGLEVRAKEPRDKMSVLWTPKLWTPQEQARQRLLIDASLAPHFENWKHSGICLDDLNPSEFEDLVGEVLLSAGLKIHKVREVPQGGRDLIVRGSLVPDEEPIEIAVEVKHRRTVDRPEVQLALYQNRAYPALLFVTSGRFSAGVFQEKAREENRFRLFLKDGLAIGDLVREHFRLEDQTRRIIAKG